MIKLAPVNVGGSSAGNRFKIHNVVMELTQELFGKAAVLNTENGRFQNYLYDDFGSVLYTVPEE